MHTGGDLAFLGRRVEGGRCLRRRRSRLRRTRTPPAPTEVLAHAAGTTWDAIERESGVTRAGVEAFARLLIDRPMVATRPIDEQTGERLDASACAAPLSRSMASHGAAAARATASSTPVVCAWPRRRGRCRRWRRGASQDADQECQVAAGVHVEPEVGDARAERARSSQSTAPSSAPAGLPIRIDDGDLRAALLGLVQVLDRDRLVVGDVRAEEDDQVGLDPVRVGARRGADAERAFIAVGRRGVAQPRRVVDVRLPRSAPPSAPRSRPRW